MSFTNKSKDIEKVSARLQEEAKLQAELSDTEATVRWMKDGKELKASEKYEFQSAGKRRVLKIRCAAQEDAGVYECVCEGDKMLFQLSVRGKGLLCTLGVPALNQWSHQGRAPEGVWKCPSMSSLGCVVPQQNWEQTQQLQQIQLCFHSSWHLDISREFGEGEWWVGKSS